MSLSQCRSSLLRNTTGLERDAQLMYALSEQTFWTSLAPKHAQLHTRQASTDRRHGQLRTVIFCSSPHQIGGSVWPGMVSLRAKGQRLEIERAVRHSKVSRQASLAPASSSSTGSEGHHNKLISRELLHSSPAATPALLHEGR